jgi:hypothetical protein
MILPHAHSCSKSMAILKIVDDLPDPLIMTPYSDDTIENWTSFAVARFEPGH